MCWRQKGRIFLSGSLVGMIVVLLFSVSWRYLLLFGSVLALLCILRNLGKRR